MKNLSFLMILAAVLTLSACKDSATNASGNTAAAPASAISMAALAAEAKGFNSGSAVSARTVYVFFDAQCPHCATLWLAAKPLKAQARFVWIPVGILNPASTLQGAALLAAADPVAAMDAHEASLKAQQGGINAEGDLTQQKALIGKNTELMTRYGFSSIPIIVGTHAQTGALVTQEGAVPTAALATLLGLEVPAGS